MSNPFAEFLARLKAHESAASREVFERFTHQLIGLAHRQFSPAFRNRVDPEDVVQSAYKSFFRRFGEGKLEVGNWDSLWGLLSLITLRKCSERVAYHRAQCRDAAREVVVSTGAESGATWPEAPGREPTPLEAAMLSETLEQLFASLDEDEQPILDLSLQGYTTREISEQLGRAERTVRLVRECVRHRLERLQRGPP
jgi:RNA polymerase sigma-70 factor (ECF subfamily)